MVLVVVIFLVAHGYVLVVGKRDADLKRKRDQTNKQMNKRGSNDDTRRGYNILHVL